MLFLETGAPYRDYKAFLKSLWVSANENECERKYKWNLGYSVNVHQKVGAYLSF